MVAFALTLIATANLFGHEFMKAFHRLQGLVSANKALNLSAADAVLLVSMNLARTLPMFLAMFIALAANLVF